MVRLEREGNQRAGEDIRNMVEEKCLEMVQPLGKTIGQFLKKLNRVTICPTTRCMPTIHNNQIVETTEISRLTKYGVSIQWNLIQILKGMKYYYMLQHR